MIRLVLSRLRANSPTVLAKSDMLDNLDPPHSRQAGAMASLGGSGFFIWDSSIQPSWAPPNLPEDETTLETATLRSLSIVVDCAATLRR